jgi:GAF domain-containing protein
VVIAPEFLHDHRPGDPGRRSPIFTPPRCDVEDAAELLKSVGLAAAMTTALIARGVPEPTAHLAGELGVLTFRRGYTEWSESDHDDAGGLAHHALAALEDLRTAATTLR